MNLRRYQGKQYQGVCQKNLAAKNGLKHLQNALKKLDKMGVVVLSYHHSEMHEMPVIEALHTKATEGLVMLGKAKLVNHGVDDTGKYGVYGMRLGPVYLRFVARP